MVVFAVGRHRPVLTQSSVFFDLDHLASRRLCPTTSTQTHYTRATRGRGLWPLVALALGGFGPAKPQEAQIAPSSTRGMLMWEERRFLVFTGYEVRLLFARAACSGGSGEVFYSLKGSMPRRLRRSFTAIEVVVLK